MNICKACHVPSIISRDHAWNDDGSITLTTIPDFRMVLMEVPLVNTLAARLEDMVGPTVKDLMTEGSRRGAYNYASGLLKGPLKFIVRHTGTGAKIAYSKLMDSAWALGLGKIVMDSYEFRKRLTGRAYNGFNLPLMTGIVHGAYEAIEGFSGKSEWKEKGQHAEVSIWTEKGAQAIEKTPAVVSIPRPKGKIVRDRCPTCGLPKDIARFKWRPEKGDIEDERTGTRMVFIGLTDMMHVIRTLEGTIGQKVSETVRAVNVDLGRELVKKGGFKSMDDLAMDLSAKGLASMSVSKEGKATSLSIGLQYHKEYIIGRCLGVYESIEGPGFGFNIKDTGPGTIALTMSKK